MSFEINKVVVIGSGTMGSGIALVLANAGVNVSLVDLEKHLLDKGLKHINKQLQRSVERDKISKNDAESILTRIHPTTDINEATVDIQLLIEAIIEDKAAKSELFKQLDIICDSDTIFASNTSAINISDLAASTNRPSKFLGIHFFNPPHIMKLVEVIRGKKTADETVNLAINFCERLGKTPVLSNESPGFIVNRLLWPFLNESYKLLDTKVAEKEAIDTAVKLGLNHPMGPLELSDYIGLDVMLDIGKYITQELGDEYKPAKILSDLVNQGKLGRKTKQGLYSYE